MRKELAKQITNCIKYHTPEDKAYIKIVVNSVVDPEMIQLLYKASMAGVKVDLVVRGICCIRPGIPGVSENIRVKSIVGRFLEHCRIYYFKYQGESRIWMGSADLMRRNLDRRVELVFPVQKKEIKQRLRFIIQILLDDNSKTRLMDAEGFYHRVKPGKDEVKVDAQKYFLRLAKDMHKGIDTIAGGPT
jgi:polyphosphate kinase